MQQRVIHTKTVDFIFIKFPVVFPIIYGVLFYLFPGYENFIILGTLILLAEPHFGATWPFLINSFNQKKILSEKLNFILIPFAIILISLFLFNYNKNLLYLIFYLANFYHVTRQSTGVSKLFISNSDQSEVKFHINTIYIFGILFGIIGLLRFQFTNIINISVFYLNIFMLLLITLVLIYYYLKYKNFKNIYLLLTGILIFYPVCFVNAPIHAIIMGVTMHYTQYIFITYKVNLGRLIDMKNGIPSKYKNFLVIIFIYGIIMGVLGMANIFNNHTIGNIIVVPLIGQLLHFYYDTLLWKFSDDHNRKVTLHYI